MMKETAPLRLEIELPEMPLSPQGSRRIKARLTNTGEAAIVINRRLAVGYRDHLARELFAELRNPETGTHISVQEVDYDRAFSPPSDYGPLEPEQSVEASFDFFEWYHPMKGGTYLLILHYQADEPLAKAPPGLAAGIHSSRPAAIRVELESGK